MDQNTNQGAAQQGGGQYSNPFYDASTQGQGQGTNPPADDSGSTPPWLSFSPTGDTAQATDPFAGNATFTPPATDTTSPLTTMPSNPWEAAASPTPVAQGNPWDNATVPDTSAPVMNPWDANETQETETTQVTNPWDNATAEEAQTTEPDTTPWEDTSSQDVPEEEPVSTFSDPIADKKSSDDLLAELKRRFEEEEAEVDEEIQVHEENIKAEQNAIRALKSSRKEQIERMRGMFQELKVILKLDKEEAPQVQNKPKPQHPQGQPRPQHPRPQQPQRDRNQPQKPAQAA